MPRRPSFPDFELYRELEVDPRATTETIEAAYYSLTNRNHPDAPIAVARARFARLNVARDWLTDPNLRREYDEYRAVGTKPNLRSAVPDSSSTKPWAIGPPAHVVLPGRAPIGVRLFGYLGGCVIAVLVAQVGAWLFGVFATFTALAGFITQVAGAEVASGIIQLLGNLAFAAIFGYLVAELVGWLVGTSSTLRGRYVAGVTAGVLAFVFPALSVGAVLWLADVAPDVVRPIVDRCQLKTRRGIRWVRGGGRPRRARIVPSRRVTGVGQGRRLRLVTPKSRVCRTHQSLMSSGRRRGNFRPLYLLPQQLLTG